MTSPGPILVVDDNAANLKVARLALESEGYAVRVAADGLEALAQVQTHHPPLVLMDLQMPGMDGLELTRRLKHDPATRDIVIVAVTAYAMKGDREKALAAGCDDYLSKPLDPIALPARVARLLKARGRASAPASPVPTPLLGSASILVIEDNAATRKMMRVALQAEGYAVVEAGDGRTAIDLVRRQPPDLILQDLILPDMDGIELVTRLREVLGNRDIPIFCLTGFLSRLEETRAAPGGFAVVLVKPIDLGQLVELIKAHLPSMSPAEATAGAGRRLLLADDDPFQRKVSGIILRKAGFTVIEVSDGQEALDRARAERPLAIVSDVLMPRKDGFELTLAIRRDPDLATLPIVLLSSHYVERADIELARRVGADALLMRKPDLGGVVPTLLEALQNDRRPAPALPVASLQSEHEGRVLWQLERQVQQNVGLAQRCAFQATQLTVLAGAAQALASGHSLDGALGEVLASCLDMAGISRGMLYLRGADGVLTLDQQIGFAERDRPALAHLFGHEALIVEATRPGRIILIPSRQPLPAQVERDILDAMAVTSALLVPVVGNGELFGFFLLGGRTTDVTTSDSVAFARVMATQLAQALSLARTFDRLSAAETRYRTMMDHARDPVAVSTSEGVIQEVNRRWEELLDRPRAQIVGRHISELVPAADGLMLGTPTAARTSPLGVQVAGGAEVLMEFSVTPLELGGQRLFLSVGRDVTERVRTQAQLMMADRLASVGMLAAALAHEINNPLAAVTANLDLALIDSREAASGKHDPAALDRDLRDAREAAVRVSNIVRDVKLFSRGEEEKPGPIVVDSVLEAAVRMTWNEIRHRARLVRDYRETPAVLGNESRLGQVFVNLLVNAVHAIPQGRVRENEIRLTSRREGTDRVVIEVSDTGAGIPPDVVSHLFTPFFTTKRGTGTGLGLSICQRIITQMGGTVSIDTAVGRGTTFRITLPAHEEPARPTPIAPTTAIAPAQRARVLIVDDEVLLSNALCRLLAPEHDAVAAPNGREALQRIRAGERFDVIFSDLMMPQMTGMEFFAELARLAPEQAERVVFLTGGAFSAEARNFLNETSNACLEKPIEARILRAFLAARLGDASVNPAEEPGR